jgi:tetratricopeptide (TPR) repeat protein
MNLDPSNPIVQLCVAGMALEGEGKPADALRLFQQAWEHAATPLEQCTAAHYVARHQPDAAAKLRWDEIALQLAINQGEAVAGNMYPSFYLNVAKGYEDLGQRTQALESYRLASFFIDRLPANGYRNMIEAGIANGLQRVKGNAD